MWATATKDTKKRIVAICGLNGEKIQSTVMETYNVMQTLMMNKSGGFTTKERKKSCLYINSTYVKSMKKDLISTGKSYNKSQAYHTD